MKENILDKYRKYFPEKEIKALYPFQEKSIGLLLDGKNCLTITPTGGGKSLVYQLAGLEMENSTLVISPLKALMQEQVNDLIGRGISAVAVTSDTGFQIQRQVLRNLGKKDYKFIFVSPERLQNYFFRAALLHSGKKIDQIVIDEAHCISQWGFDFRPEYGEINRFIAFLKDNAHNPVVCGLTATLSSIAAGDIKAEFSITEDIVFGKESLIRPELKLNFVKTDDKSAEEQKWEGLLAFLKDHNSSKALIYLYSKKKAEELSHRFNSENPISGLTADYFHADLKGEEKLIKYVDFKSGKINIMFTTTAFGMGMNIPDIDTIIQYHLPKSIEDYYQQIGRGARDIEICPQCHCLLFWSEKNIRSNIQEIESERLTAEKIKRGCEHLGLSGESGNVSSISTSELTGAKINLPKLRFYLEKLKVIETLGEINGGPESIRFITDTSHWLKIKEASFANSFIFASEDLKIPVQDLINYVFDEDLRGNVEFLPAMDKKLFLREIQDGLSESVFDEIINDVNNKVEYHLDRFAELEKLCKSSNPYGYLESVFSKL